MKSLKVLSPFLLGFFCLGFQIIIVREFSAVFWGNELNFGLILGFWLLWEGLGALIAERIHFSEDKIYSFYLITILFFSFSLILLRLNRFLIHKLPGEIPPFHWIIFFSALLTLMVSFLLGVLFVMNVKLLNERLGITYILESLGSSFGSIFVYFFIVPYTSNWIGTTIVGLIGILILLLIFRPNLKLFSLSFLLVFILIIFGFFADNFFAKRYWSPLEIVISKDSKFGKISVVDEKGELSVYENSMLSFSSHEREGGEESVHFPFLLTKSPIEILIIGGGFGGALREAIKYKDVKIDYLELDPEIIRISEGFKDFKGFFEEERIRFHWGDARSFLQRERKKWDCIIMSLPEPINAQINRLYTKEFYSLVKERLKNGGIFSFKVLSSAEYINLDLQKVLSIHFDTLKSVFPYVNYIPGGTCIFLASKEPFEISVELILQKKEELGIETSFINERYLMMRMSPIRYTLLESALKTEQRINSDFNPSLYLFQLNYLSGYHGKIEKKFFNFLISVPTFWLIELPLIIFAVFVIFKFVAGKGRSYMLPVFGIGFTTLSMEILIVLAYQVFYGYFYGRIALLLFSFMVGLTIGSSLTKLCIKPSPQILSIFQFLMLSLTGFSYLFFKIPVSIIAGSLCHLLIFFLLFFYGLISGSIFIIANELFIEEKKQFGLGWAVDLGGSTIGALSISAILLPVAGFFPILKFFLIFNLLIFLYTFKK
jgi:spermidine synthase